MYHIISKKTFSEELTVRGILDTVGKTGIQAVIR